MSASERGEGGGGGCWGSLIKLNLQNHEKEADLPYSKNPHCQVSLNSSQHYFVQCWHLLESCVVTLLPFGWRDVVNVLGHTVTVRC